MAADPFLGTRHQLAIPPRAVRRLDGKSDGLNNYLLEALALADNVPENSSPPFVRRTWLHLVENLRHLSQASANAQRAGPV